MSVFFSDSKFASSRKPREDQEDAWDPTAGGVKSTGDEDCEEGGEERDSASDFDSDNEGYSEAEIH